MANAEIKRLAQELLQDLLNSSTDEIVITSEGRVNSLSKAEFDELQALILEVAPNATVSYRLQSDGLA
jgi:hypothetical protein